MDYATNFTHHQEFWVLSFPEMPDYWVVASTCNELVSVAEDQLGEAL
jgi:hypothetical protein